MPRYFTVFFLGLFLAQNIHAQTLRGTVAQAVNGQPVVGATVVFVAKNGQTFQKKTTDNGRFQMDSLPIGNGQLTVESAGFSSYLLLELPISGGKECVVSVLLTEGMLEGSTLPVEIVEARPLRQVAPIGEIPLSRQQTLYNPMTYYDPARLATAYPGVAQVDDGTNAMSIRGNNPALVRWRLNGMDIVSPNHLPNAGTLSDQPTATSGGVMMLSAQMLDQASLITGAGLSNYNDGIGGIMDLQLRKGNTERHEQTIQAGLIGIDAAVEGPLSKRHRGSYLLNYRYSFVGLVGLMGVSFGGEKITFQDIAAHVYLPGKKRNTWSIYLLGGQSSNVFSPPDSATVYKELFNIDFASRTGVLGVQQTAYIGERFVSKFGLSASWQGNERVQYTPDSTYSSTQIEETKFVLNYTFKYHYLRNHALLAGYNALLTTYFGFNNVGEDPLRNQIDGNFVSQVWLANESSYLQGAVKLHYGINGLLSVYGRALNPRLQAAWKPNRRHQLVLNVATYSQALPLWQTVNSGGSTLLLSSINAIRYNYTPNRRWAFSGEAFIQHISNIPTDTDPLRPAFSFVNINERVSNQFANSLNGVADNNGVELSAIHHFSRSWFLNANVTLLKSTYQGADGITRRTRWDVGRIANLTAGKEWQLRPKRENTTRRLLGVSGRATYMGGYRTAPIDKAWSDDVKGTVYSFSEGYPNRQPDYARLDGRIYWKRSISNRRNSTFALEFQNLTSRKNVAYAYYDPFTRLVTTKYQLGFIPNLSWRLEW